MFIDQRFIIIQKVLSLVFNVYALDINYKSDHFGQYLHLLLVLTLIFFYFIIIFRTETKVEFQWITIKIKANLLNHSGKAIYIV